MVTESKPSIKIPFTFSSKKKCILVQNCFLTGRAKGAEGTRLRKAWVLTRRGVCLRATSPRTREGKDSPLAHWRAGEGLYAPSYWAASWKILSSMSKQIISHLWERDIFLHWRFQYPRGISNDVNVSKKARKKKNKQTAIKWQLPQQKCRALI